MALPTLCSSLVYPAHAVGKGRIVLASVDIQPGREILKERPLMVVRKRERSKSFKEVQKICKQLPETFAGIDYMFWAALQLALFSKDRERKAMLSLHHQPIHVDYVIVEACKQIGQFFEIDPKLLLDLFWVWSLNAYGHTVCFCCSIFSHSCNPNAEITEHPDGSVVVRSLRHINANEEICTCYDIDNRLAPTFWRRANLYLTKHFRCECDRCAAAADLSRGVQCPQCDNGTIYSVSIDASDDQCYVDIVETGSRSNMWKASAWTDRVCDSCSHKLAVDEARSIADKEKYFDVAIEDLTRQSSLVSVLTLVQAASVFFKQHFLMFTICSSILEHELMPTKEGRDGLKCIMAGFERHLNLPSSSPPKRRHLRTKKLIRRLPKRSKVHGKVNSKQRCKVKIKVKGIVKVKVKGNVKSEAKGRVTVEVKGKVKSNMKGRVKAKRTAFVIGKVKTKYKARLKGELEVD